MVLRQRIKKVVSVKTVKVLDAFPKLEQACQEGTPVGGTVSVITYLIILWLVISETSYYLHSKIVYKFLPDTDFDARLSVFIDLTIAMPCATVGADILDSTNQNIVAFGHLEEENTWFELEPAQRVQFEHIQSVNAYLRSDYHHVHEFLWRSSKEPFHDIPKRKRTPTTPSDACRIYGKLELNKVAGNFHITAGKSLQMPRGHIHISPFLTERDYNFSHRINHFAFGDSTPGIIQPLEGDERVTTENMMLYQYFLEVVPTEVETFLTSQKTFQYSAKNQERSIDHMSGSHGIPGIFFKYDMSALKVRILQERDPFHQFLIKLCATVGGVYVTLGIITAFLRIITCRVNVLEK